MVPIIMSVGFYLLQEATSFSKIKPWIQQVIIGAVFGIAAIYGTAFGVDVGGAAANARDAAPLCAGLFFGGPAGIIAGTIGAIYRWIASYFGVGVYTRVACTVSTFIAGIYAALLRKFVFEKKNPGWYTAFLVGVIIEVFHLLMVFLTHAGDATQALEVIKICTLPMILVNAAALAIASALLHFLRKILVLKQGEHLKEEKPTISDRIQLVLLLIVVVAFVATSGVSYVIQTNQTLVNANKLLTTNINDTAQEVSDTLDRGMADTASEIAREYENGTMGSLEETAKWYRLTEVNIVDKNGIITESTNSSFVGFDMKSGEQSLEFMPLATNEDGVLVQDFMPIAKDQSIKRKYAGAGIKGGGFIQIGVDDTIFHEQIGGSLTSIANNRHIGNTGYILVANTKNRIISSPDTSLLGKNLMATGLWIWDDFAEMKRYQVETDAGEVFLMFQDMEGYSIIGVYPVKEAMTSRDFNVYMNSFTQVLVFAFLFSAAFFAINSVVVKKLKEVNNGLEKITDGDLNEVIDVRTTEEFNTLSNEINTTVDRLKEYIAEAAARIDAELEFAKNIQCSSLPSDFPAFPEKTQFDIYATMDAAKEVGGDFYDFYLPEENKLAFLIADVSGKGIPAAMFMMQAKTMINGFTSAGLSVDKAFTMSNSKLCENNEAEMFVTAWQGVLDITTGHVEFANAGHNPPVLYRKGEGWTYLKSRAGFVLAGMDGVQYKKQELELKPGDKIYLYTDGVVEAQNIAEELYGEDRLLNYLNAHPDDGPEEVLRGVRKDVDAFVGEADQFDDMTMLMIEFKG